MNQSGHGRPSGLDTTQLVTGLALVGLGVLFILGQADVLSVGDVISSIWPVVLIAYGVIHYFNSRHTLSSLVIIAIGAVLLLFTLDIAPGSALSLIGPILLIALGIWIIQGRMRVSGKPIDDTVNAFALFGSAEVVRQSRAFVGGSMTVLFGEGKLDLRPATLAPEGAQVDVLVAFGDAVILVPPGWRIVMGGIPIFAGNSDKTEYAGELPADSPTLTVNAVALFADVTVRNA